MFPDFQPYSWLLVHMQILHFPMLLWYLGCRMNCISNDPIVCSLSRKLFPILWMLSTSYRATIMLCCSSTALRASQYAPATLCFVFGVTLMKLDFDWMKYFFGKSEGCLNWPLSTFIMTALYLIGILIGYHISSMRPLF
jgi:hypothetical protein